MAYIKGLEKLQARLSKLKVNYTISSFNRKNELFFIRVALARYRGLGCALLKCNNCM